MESRTNTSLYWTLLAYKDWSFYIAASENGLSYVGSQEKPFDEMSNWIRRRFPDSELVQDDEKMAPYVKELIEYLQGKRQMFTIPFDYRGTPFQLAVWKALGEIPYGQTWSYSDIATHIQKPAAVRAVGTAIGANPILITVPCHRVIGKNGTLTGYRGGLEMKTKLLHLESRKSTQEC
ncbi:Methylated-DNA--protein-cysteine methyltransferase, inducible [compost metagenome]